MRVKILVIGLICLFALSGCTSPADPEIEKALNPGPTDLPVIDFFTANYQGNQTQTGEIIISRYTLFWSVTNATIVSIDQRIGEVLPTDTREVEIRETTTYTLTAENDNGQKTAFCVAELIVDDDGFSVSLIEFEFTTIPELPIFTYYPDSDTSKSTFTIVITETAGKVGGGFDGTVQTFVDDNNVDGCENKHFFEWRTIEAFGNISYDCILEVPCRPKYMCVSIGGIDNNGIHFHEGRWILFIWAN